MRKIIITLPFGASIKNILLNPDFIPTLKKGFDKIYIFSPISEEAIKGMCGNLIDPSIKICFVPEKNNIFQIIFSQLSFVCYNEFIGSGTFKIMRNDGKLLFTMKVAMIFARVLHVVFSWRQLFEFFEKLKFLFSNNKKVSNLFYNIEPQLVFVTAASFRYDYSIAYVAHKMKIPVVGMVHSWDNLSSKGPICPNLSKVIVWNEFQFDEVLKYTNYNPEQVKKAGIPQLDWYFQHRSELDRNNLTAYIGVNVSCKIITYATGPHKMIPYESEIVEKIVDSVNKKFKKTDVVFLVRIHPKDDIIFYKKLRKYKNVIVESPTHKTEACTADRMTFDMVDIKHYGEVISSSDVVLNIASTVFLEALAMGTPVINILFDEKPREYYSSVRRYYDFNHSKYLLGLGTSYVVRELGDLTGVISSCFEESSCIKERRLMIAEKVAYKLDGRAGERIGAVLIDFLNDIKTSIK